MSCTTLAALSVMFAASSRQEHHWTHPQFSLSETVFLYHHLRVNWDRAFAVKEK